MAAPPSRSPQAGCSQEKEPGTGNESSDTARREPRSSSLSTPAATLWPSTTIGPRRDDDVVGAVEKNLLNADYTLLVITFATERMPFQKAKLERRDSSPPPTDILYAG